MRLPNHHYSFGHTFKIALVVAVVGGVFLLPACRQNKEDTASAASSTAPRKPPGPSVYIQGRNKLIAIEHGHARIVESRLSVYSALPARTDGIHFMPRKGEVVVATRRGGRSTLQVARRTSSTTTE